MQLGLRNQRCQKTNQIVVHVPSIHTKSTLPPWIAHGGRRCGHDCGNDRVHLGDGGIGEVETIRGKAVQRFVVQHDNGVRVLDQTTRSRDGVVRLNNDIRSALLRIRQTLHTHEIWENRIGLDQLLRKRIVQILQKVGTHAGSRSSRNTVHQHESLHVTIAKGKYLKTVAVLRLARQDIHHGFTACAPLLISRSPVVSRSRSIRSNESSSHRLNATYMFSGL